MASPRATSSWGIIWHHTASRDMRMQGGDGDGALELFIPHCPSSLLKVSSPYGESECEGGGLFSPNISRSAVRTGERGSAKLAQSPVECADDGQALCCACTGPLPFFPPHARSPVRRVEHSPEVFTPSCSACSGDASGSFPHTYETSLIRGFPCRTSDPIGWLELHAAPPLAPAVRWDTHSSRVFANPHVTPAARALGSVYDTNSASCTPCPTGTYGSVPGVCNGYILSANSTSQGIQSEPTTDDRLTLSDKRRNPARQVVHFVAEPQAVHGSLSNSRFLQAVDVSSRI
ncbi:hypothetical protein R3P38DRAFT_3471501 [Favolaschia claudopus]|uniref:Uncharacterized protein n=1 Tax=Favolaschia claudopus TaxID=2862362 RepID=A0AAV9ZCL8_9AGAR